MTDFKDDEKATQDKSFKEKILIELEEANRLRLQREEEIRRKEQEAQELARLQEIEKNAQLQAAEQAEKERQEQERIEQLKRQEAEHLKIAQALIEQQKAQEDVRPEQVANEPVSADEASSSQDQQEAISENTDRDVSKMKRQRQNRVAAKISAILITVIILVAAAGAFFGYRYVAAALGPLDKSASQYVTVDIPSGSGNKYIGQILQKNGLIKDASIFNYYTKFKNVSNLQSGYYNLKASMTLDEIVKELQKGGTSQPEAPAAGKILVKEGYTIKQIAEAVTKNVNTKKVSKTPFSSDDFLALMKDETFIAKMVAKYPDLLSNLPSASEATYQLEGYLYPATYNYYEKTDLEGLVDEMLSTMNTHLKSYYSQIKSSGYNVNQILTLASLVEKEGSTDDDRRNIASVFYNRLKANMPLQSNIAILYAMGKLGEETTLKEDATIDTTIDSPYNDYTNTGLMPGPVDSPSLAAIEATIKPASTNYLYFVADVKTGKVYYSEDYDTHLQNVDKYVNSQISSSSSAE